jgi:hypothetical protein
MKTLIPKINITDSRFNYVSSAKTDIRDTFRKFSASNQESKEPLVSPVLNPNGFVLSAQWFEME